MIVLCVWYASERTVDSLEVVGRLVRSQYWIENIPQSPVPLWAFDHSHSTPPSVPSLHSPRQLPVAFGEIFQALAENWAIHAVRRQSDQSCPVTMSKTATTINYFVLENTHVALFILSVRQEYVLITAIQKVLLKLSRPYGRVIFHIPGVKF